MHLDFNIEQFVKINKYLLCVYWYQARILEYTLGRGIGPKLVKGLKTAYWTCLYLKIIVIAERCKKKKRKKTNISTVTTGLAAILF